MRLHRRTLTAGLASAPIVAMLGSNEAMGQATPGASPVASGETREIVHPRGTTLVPANPQRVINLGEEWLLADLLELGIEPIATAATYATGFVGIDSDYQPEIPLFVLWEMDIETLIPLGADLILVQDYVFDIVEGLYENLSQLAPVVSVPDTNVWQDNYRFLASIFGLEAEAEATITELEAEIATTAAELGASGQTVSVATVYPGGDGFAMWVTNANPMIDLLMALGFEVLPDAATVEPDDAGRIWLSLEQVSEIQGEILIMLQTFAVETDGETEAYEQVTAEPLWQTVPAVQNDRVFVLERVGYPGEVAARRALLDAYREIFG